MTLGVSPCPALSCPVPPAFPPAQVRGVVELGSPSSPDSEKAAAIHKWATQLQSLQAAVVSKLAV